MKALAGWRSEKRGNVWQGEVGKNSRASENLGTVAPACLVDASTSVNSGLAPAFRPSLDRILPRMHR